MCLLGLVVVHHANINNNKQHQLAPVAQPLTRDSEVQYLEFCQMFEGRSGGHFISNLNLFLRHIDESD